MKVAILYDDVFARRNATPDEWGVMEAVLGVEGALRDAGHATSRVPAGPRIQEWGDHLQALAPAVVFNLCEGLGGRSAGEVDAAAAVEELGIPLTGSPSTTLALARRKDRVNALLKSRGLPVPAWGAWAGDEGETAGAFALSWGSFPAIVKPLAEDGSVGVDQGSVVKEALQLERRLEWMKTVGPLLVQSFVGTREINAGVVGREVLPLSEIVFDELPPGHHPLVGYEAKWSPGSPEDLGTRPVCPAPIPGSLAARMRLLALKAWQVVGGRGYGRVDFRFTPPDSVWILEVNPNPDLSPSAGLARAAGSGGLSFRNLVERILQEALPAPDVRKRTLWAG